MLKDNDAGNRVYFKSFDLADIYDIEKLYQCSYVNRFNNASIKAIVFPNLTFSFHNSKNCTDLSEICKTGLISS